MCWKSCLCSLPTTLKQLYDNATVEHDLYYRYFKFSAMNCRTSLFFLSFSSASTASIWLLVNILVQTLVQETDYVFLSIKRNHIIILPQMDIDQVFSEVLSGLLMIFMTACPPTFTVVSLFQRYFDSFQTDEVLQIIPSFSPSPPSPLSFPLPLPPSPSNTLELDLLWVATKRTLFGLIVNTGEDIIIIILVEIVSLVGIQLKHAWTEAFESVEEEYSKVYT